MVFPWKTWERITSEGLAWTTTCSNPNLSSSSYHVTSSSKLTHRKLVSYTSRCRFRKKHSASLTTTHYKVSCPCGPHHSALHCKVAPNPLAACPPMKNAEVHKEQRKKQQSTLATTVLPLPHPRSTSLSLSLFLLVFHNVHILLFVFRVSLGPHHSSNVRILNKVLVRGTPIRPTLGLASFNAWL